MPSNMALGWRGKPVLVAVYVETPRKRRFITNSGQKNCQGCHLHHHHHVHRDHHVFIRQKPGNRGGYNRRAELLDYSRRLRESAKLTKPTPLLPPQPQPVDSLHRSSSQIIPVRNKFRPARVPTCFGCLTIRLPGFSGAKRERKKKRKSGQSTKSRMISIVKIIQVRKKSNIQFPKYKIIIPLHVSSKYESAKNFVGAKERRVFLKNVWRAKKKEVKLYGSVS